MNLARWWSIPVGAALMLIGVFLQAPYPFAEVAGNGGISRGLFLVGGGMLAMLPWTADRRFRSAAAAVACAACASRSATVVFVARTPVPISWQNQVVGALVWSTLGYVIAVMIVATFAQARRR